MHSQWFERHVQLSVVSVVMCNTESTLFSGDSTSAECAYEQVLTSHLFYRVGVLRMLNSECVRSISLLECVENGRGIFVIVTDSFCQIHLSRIQRVGRFNCY